MANPGPHSTTQTETADENGSGVWPIYYTGAVLGPASAERTFAGRPGHHLGEGPMLAALAAAAVTVVATCAGRALPHPWAIVQG